MPPIALIEPAAIDYTRVLADREAIRSVNSQRFEMEQLDGVVLIDRAQQMIVGFKDVSEDEFWVRGHMPGYPLLPGVLMCEAAAQLTSYYCHLEKMIEDGFIGFGGMEDVKFRGVVKPGDRLVLVAKAVKLHRRQTIFETQGFVGLDMVFQARVIGVPIRSDARDPGRASLATTA